MFARIHSGIWALQRGVLRVFRGCLEGVLGGVLRVSRDPT